MKKLCLAILASTLASVAVAEEYQFIGNVSYTDTDAEGAEPTIGVDGVYYFSAQKALGPLDQFAYIDDTTNLRANIESTDGDNSTSVGGSYYFSRFALGADLSDDDGSSASKIHGDFFILSNLKASITYSMPDEGDDVAGLNLYYDHKLNDSDYIGFTLSVEDDAASTKSLSTKYFNALDNGTYLVLEASIDDNDFDTTTSISGNYYFSKYTGIKLGASSSDNVDTITVGAKHFFNTNFALGADLAQSSFGSEDSTSYKLTASLQF